MNGLLKYGNILITLGAVAAIIYGFSIQDEFPVSAKKWIGSGTLGLFLIAMPLFLIRASRGKKMKDYMLNEENIHKMRNSQSKHQENENRHEN
jgi:uncharacterized membrane protein